MGSDPVLLGSVPGDSDIVQRQLGSVFHVYAAGAAGAGSAGHQSAACEIFIRAVSFAAFKNKISGNVFSCCQGKFNILIQTEHFAVGLISIRARDGMSVHIYVDFLALIYTQVAGRPPVR